MTSDFTRLTRTESQCKMQGLVETDPKGVSCFSAVHTLMRLVRQLWHLLCSRLVRVRRRGRTTWKGNLVIPLRRLAAIDHGARERGYTVLRTTGIQTNSIPSKA